MGNQSLDLERVTLAQSVKVAQADEKEFPQAKVKWYELLLAFFVPLLVFGLLSPHILQWLNPPTGDEPYYLVTAISLIQDHDIDESNQYQNHAYWDFYPTCAEVQSIPDFGSSSKSNGSTANTPGILAPGIPCPDFGNFQYLAPHTSKDVIRPGLYTKHGLGVSFLIAPAYWLGQRPATMYFMNFLAALLSLNLFLLAYETCRKRWISWLVWACMTFTAPLLSYAFLIFPATPAALFTIYAWRRCRLAAQARIWARENHTFAPTVNNVWRVALIALCLGILPWLHSVYLSIAFPLGFYFLLGGRDLIGNTWRWLHKRYSFPIIPDDISILAFTVFLIIVAFFGGLFITYYVYYYGTPLPNTQDHAGFASITDIWNGMLGLLFDQKYGLLIYSPLYLIPLAGIALLFFKTGNAAETRRRRADLVWLLIAMLPNFLIMADYNQWWGEWCPPARYLVPFLPLLAMPFSFAFDQMQTWVLRVFFGIAAIWAAGVAVAFMYNPHLQYHWEDHFPARLILWLQQNIPFLHGQNISAWFPSYVMSLEPSGGIGTWLAPLLWVAGAVVLAIAMVWRTLYLRGNKHRYQRQTEISFSNNPQQL